MDILSLSNLLQETNEPSEDVSHSHASSFAAPSNPTPMSTIPIGQNPDTYVEEKKKGDNKGSSDDIWDEDEVPDEEAFAVDLNDKRKEPKYQILYKQR